MTMRQFLKSLFQIGPKYLVVVARGANISRSEIKDAIANGGVVSADGDPNKSVAVIELR
jgi:hypothetical protein